LFSLKNISFCFIVSSVLNLTLSNHTNFVNGLAFSSDHSYLASCSADNLNIWSATTSWSLIKHLNNGQCHALVQLPNGQLATSLGSYINIWSPLNNSPSPVRTLTGHSSTVWSLALSPDGSLLASGSFDYTTKLWNYTSQSTALKTLTGHTNYVRAVCFVSNQLVASGSYDFTIKIWDISSGKLEYIFMSSIY
jgi:WD40 repeat protein